jgi:hypothetical protein
MWNSYASRAAGRRELDALTLSTEAALVEYEV